MRLRSGVEFAPYFPKRTTQHCAPLDIPISTTVSVEPLLQGAAALEDSHFERGGDDSEGLGVTSRPSTPVNDTESESEDSSSAERPAQPLSSSGKQPTGSVRKHRTAGAIKRRAKKRVKRATSGHRPLAYAANPSSVSHHAEALKPLQVPADAESFPASRSGSWVGRRKKGVRKGPWTVQDLIKKDFTFVEWDGR